jgi:asparagine synthetase B (glutamine-hydrolysing)
VSKCPPTFASWLAFLLMALVNALGLSPLEVATGIVLGRDPEAPELPEPEAGITAFEALEQAILPAVARSPCLVSFSGGRDSSAVLAVATRLARREGLPDPIPATTLFPAGSDADEVGWQERVIRHLGLSDWIRLEFDDELDLVGPVARRVLHRHGLCSPVNIHMHAPLIEAAAGGSLLTGVGGDETLDRGPRALAVLAGHVRPTPRDVFRIGFALAPRRVRRAVMASRGGPTFAWLKPEPTQKLAAAWVLHLDRFPLRWDARLKEWWTSRYLRLYMRSKAAIAADADVNAVHPFADGLFVSTLASEVGMRGFSGRTQAMRAFFGDLLPDDVTARSTKATFDEVLWSRHSQAFSARLLREGLGPALERLDIADLVDTAALATKWLSPETPSDTFALLQACWVALETSHMKP